MKLILDTCVLLWMASNPAKLSARIAALAPEVDVPQADTIPEV